MRRGTTPTHTFTLPVDTEMISKLRITYAQNGRTVLKKTVEGSEIEDGVAKVRLTQAETLSFAERGFVEIQVKALTTGGDVLESDIFTVHPLRVLDEEEIS